MTNSVWGKIGGWAAFALGLLGQVAQSGGPHGWAGWLSTIGGLLAAVGIHAASNTDGQK